MDLPTNLRGKVAINSFREIFVKNFEVRLLGVVINFLRNDSRYEKPFKKMEDTSFCIFKHFIGDNEILLKQRLKKPLKCYNTTQCSAKAINGAGIPYGNDVITNNSHNLFQTRNMTALRLLS